MNLRRKDFTFDHFFNRMVLTVQGLVQIWHNEICDRARPAARGLAAPLSPTALLPNSGYNNSPGSANAEPGCRQHRTTSPDGLSTASAAAARHLRVAKMLDNVGLRYPHRASGAKAPRTLRPLPLLRFAVSATGGAHLCSIHYYLRFWLSICRTSLAVSALRIMRYCLK